MLNAQNKVSDICFIRPCTLHSRLMDIGTRVVAHIIYKRALWAAPYTIFATCICRYQYCFWAVLPNVRFETNNPKIVNISRRLM